jgi:HAD superfamily hydrolase (TIGR01509 family)
MPLKLVIFDMDGTLLEAMLDFEAIRREIGLPPDLPILETMDGMPDAGRARAYAILDRHEAEVAARSRLMPGARQLLADLRQRGIRVAVLTRNSRVSVETAAARHGLVFDLAVTREDHKPKPSPDGIHHLRAACGATAVETVMVGDFRFDIEAGTAAGVRTIALIVKMKPWAEAATWVAPTLEEVGRILAIVAEEA